MSRQSTVASLCATTVVLGVLSGCAGLGSALGLDSTFVDHADVANGATLTYSGQDENHTAETAVNGVIDPELWGKGEGWQYTFERSTQRSIDGLSFSQGSIEEQMGLGSAWLNIRLPGPKFINRVVVHAIDTDEHPFAGYDNAILQVYDPRDTFFPWKSVARIDQGKVVVPGRTPFVARAKTTFRFNQVKGDAVRFIIFSMQDSRTLSLANAEAEIRENQFGRPYAVAPERSKRTTIRIMEIEVTGTDTRPKDQSQTEQDSEIGDILMEDLLEAVP